MAFYRKLAAHTLYQVIARIASSGASFLITILIARFFGVSSYGDYAKVTAFVTLFYLFADFGFNAMFLQKDEKAEHFHDLFYTRMGLSLLLVVLVNVIAFFLPYNRVTGIGFSPFVRVSIALFSLTILTEAVLYSTFAVFQKKYLYQEFMLATICGSFTTLGLVGLFLLLHLPLLFVFLAFVLGGVVEAGVSLVFSGENPFQRVIHAKFIQELFLETLPVTLMLVFNLIYFRIDTFLLSLFRPSVDVGIYDIAYRVFDFLIALPLFLSNVLYPKLIDDEKNNRNVKAKVIQYAAWFFAFGGAVALAFWFLSPLIFFLIRKELLSAVLPLRLLLLSLPVFFATNILQWVLLSRKKQRYLAWVYFSLTLVNVFLNLVFIPHFGYVASAIITSVCEVFVLIALLIIL